MGKISYVPFVKAKGGEIMALGVVASEFKNSICPFFDYPRQDKKPTSEEFKNSAIRTIRKMKAHTQGYEEFYFDNYDLDDSLEVDGGYSYKFLLEQLTDFEVNIVPVLSVDRSDTHLNTVKALKENGVISSDVIAVRFTADDFQSFIVVEDEIDEMLAPIFELFSEIDVIFDCRVCIDLDALRVANLIDKFATDFSKKYPVRRQVVSGSSMPASISDICSVGKIVDIERNELNVFSHLTQNYIYGDYTVVSPNYSDVDLSPEILNTVMTAKIIYSYDGFHRIVRGHGLKTQGYEQYFKLLSNLFSEPFFRGETYSIGDKYFSQKARSEGNNCTPSTIVKPSVNAHITYMVKDSPI